MEKIERTAVVGGGLMGSGIAQTLAQAGCHVFVVDLTDRQIEECFQRIRRGLVPLVQTGSLSESQAHDLIDRIEGTTSLERAVKDAQFVVEAVVEKLDVKHEVFALLERYAAHDVILSTNTGSLAVGDIARFTDRPHRVVGSHFFYPTIIPLVEVVCGPRTSDETVETSVAFWRRCGKEPVVCRKDLNGFIVNRLQGALTREAISLLANSVASASDIDRATRLGLGLRMPLWGILEQRDWTGLDLHCIAAASYYPSLENSKAPLKYVVDKVSRGETGVKSGKGFFDWTGKDVELLRQKRVRQLIEMIQAVRQIMPEEETLPDNP